MAQDTPVPAFNETRCTGCGICVDVCPEHVLVMDTAASRPRMLSEVECSYCGVCEDSCPSGAISLEYEIVLGIG